MLFMVIERFKHANPKPVGERFKQKGRMLPEGLSYQASWVESTGGRCFQVMEGPDEGLVKRWTKSWDDLIDFEVVPVHTSGEFWARMALE